MTDYQDFQTPQAHATAIAATGVPLLHNANALASQTAQNIGPNSTQATAQINTTQPSYEFQIGAIVAAAPTVPFLLVTFQWSDILSGALIEQLRFWIPAGNPTSGPVVFGRGPSLASALHILLFNPDPAKAMTVAYNLLQSSRVFDKDVWHIDNAGYAAGLVPGFTLATFPSDNACMGVLSGASVGAGATSTWMFGIPSGRLVTLAGDYAGQPASNVNIQVAPGNVNNYGAGAELLDVAAPPAKFTYQFSGTHSPMLLKVQNTATSGALTLNAAMWVTE